MPEPQKYVLPCFHDVQAVAENAIATSEFQSVIFGLNDWHVLKVDPDDCNTQLAQSHILNRFPATFVTH